MIIDTDKVIQKKIEEQSMLFRKLMQELNGKVMDYETCRMLEDFLNDYSKTILSQIELSFKKIKKEFDLVKKT